MVTPLPSSTATVDFPNAISTELVEFGASSSTRPVTNWLRMPSSGLRERAPGRLRHITCTVLFRCSNGTIWLLSSNDQVVNDTRLDAAANFLVSHGERSDQAHLQIALSDLLEFPLEIKDFQLDKMAEQFHVSALVEGLVRAWMATQAGHPDVNASKLHRSALESVAQDRLADGLLKFGQCLEDEILGCLQLPAVSSLQYNYLARQETRRFRTQFAAQMPLLLFAVSQPPIRGALWTQVRVAIDSGKSWQSAISKQLTVSPAAIKALRGVPPKVIGTHWQAKIPRLLEMLDAIAPEHQPLTPEHWRLLDEQYSFAVEVFGKSNGQQALTGARLRHVMHLAIGKGQQIPTLDVVETVQLERLRSSLARALHTQLEQLKGSAPGISERALVSVNLDRYLAQLTWSRLLSLSKKWVREYAQAVADERDAIRVVAGESYWSFIPGSEFRAPGGATVSCLTNRQELQRFGEALKNCLAGRYLDTYHEGCQKGRIIIVALLAPTTRLPLSTAELGIVRPGGDGQVHLKPIQHTAIRNGAPSSLEVDALRALLTEFATPPWQEHARRGVQVLGQRQLMAHRRQSGTDPAMIVASGRALIQTIGPVRVEQLLSVVP